MQLKSVSSPTGSYFLERASAFILTSPARMTRSDETGQHIDTRYLSGIEGEAERDRGLSVASTTKAKKAERTSSAAGGSGGGGGAAFAAHTREGNEEEANSEVEEHIEAYIKEHPQQSRRHFRDLLHHRGERKDRVRKRDRAKMVGHQLHSAFKSWFKDVSQWRRKMAIACCLRMIKPWSYARAACVSGYIMER